MPSEVESLEPNLADNQLVGVGVERGLVDLHAVFFEHVKEGSFTCVIEAQEEDLGILVVEACGKKRGADRQRNSSRASGKSQARFCSPHDITMMLFSRTVQKRVLITAHR